MQITPVPAFTDNYIWMLVDSKSKQVICVDPGEALPVINFIQENDYTLAAILLTHHHDDHIGGVSALLKNNASLPVYGPKDARIPFITHSVSENDCFTVLQWQFKVLEIPGHTASHIAYYDKTNSLLFCGDTLFSAGCGRVFDGTIEQLHDSLLKLKSLPDNTLVYCAHEYTCQNLRFALSVEPENLAVKTYYQKLMENPQRCSLPSTIALEHEINPFLRISQKSVKEYANLHGCKSSDSLAIFSILRHQKNIFS